MLVLPTDLKNRIKREIVRIYKQSLDFSLSGVLTIIASICGVIGISFFKLLDEKINTVLYLLLFIFFLYTVHYCRAYYKEQKKRSYTKDSLAKIHQIAHSLRILMIEANTSIDADSTQLRLQTFKSECKKIAENLREILRLFGYPIDHVCIKSYDPRRKKKELIVIKRSDDKRIKSMDNGEAENKNTFFKILFESHFNRSLINDSELQKVKQNRKRKSPEIKYFAIGGLRKRKKLPKSLYKLLQEYGSNPDKEKISEKNNKELYASVLNRAEHYCESQLGVLISSGEREFDLKPCSGFIGMDSKSSYAWDFIDENHLNLVAGVADLLYVPLLHFNQLQKDLLTAKTSKEEYGTNE